MRAATGWKVTLLLFFITSVVESFGYSHVLAFLPVYLAGMRVHHATLWVGVLSALTFVVGLPLVPMWGIWAHRHGGKSVIIRSAYVEAVVFALLGFSHHLSGVIVAMSLVGFQLGNTGIMLSSLRRLVPDDRVGSVVSTFSVASLIGMALGPLVGGWLVHATAWTLHDIYYLDAAMSGMTGTMLLVGYRESARDHDGAVRESAWRAAWSSVRFTFNLPVTLLLFGIYGLLMVTRQMVNPYVPVAIEHFYHHPRSVTVAIGAMVGLAALVGAGITIVAGRLGDRIGFTKVLATAFAVSIPAAALLGVVRNLLVFGVVLTVFSAAVSISGAMIFALFSTRIPATHRHTALNLVYLPMYLGGIVGPLMASGLTSLGVAGPFSGAALAAGVGLLVILRKMPGTAQESELTATVG